MLELADELEFVRHRIQDSKRVGIPFAGVRVAVAADRQVAHLGHVEDRELATFRFVAIKTLLEIHLGVHGLLAPHNARRHGVGSARIAAAAR
jgi:hypothetical protein